MNGRVYDPALGRFLSVDPVYQAPTNMQSLNPYSYVLNNPLSLTDPSGYVTAPCEGSDNCPDQNSGTTTTTVTVSAHVSMDVTGSHVGNSVTVTATGTATTTTGADGKTTTTVTFGGGGDNGHDTQQSAGDAIRNEPGQGGGASKTAVTGLVQNDGKGNISLTREGEKLATAVALGLPNQKAENESYKLIGADGDVSKLETEGCSNKACTVNLDLIRTPVIEVHDHVNDPSGGVANESRAWPGPGDQDMVQQKQVINVFKGNDGAVRAIELRDGRPVVRTIYGGDSKLNSYIERNWTPYKYPGGSMPDSAVSQKQAGFDDGHQ